MSRQRKRAEKPVAPPQPVIRAVAVHEAGHCVARVLTSDSLGWDASEVIEYIEVGSAPVATGVSQGLRSQVVSWGRFLSKPMQGFVAARRVTTTRPSGPHDSDLALLFAEMRATGIDLDGWFRARSIVAIFGPMAEAKLIDRPFNEVWNNSPSKDDQRAVIRAGTLCGMTREQIASAASEIASICEQQMARSEVWHAITTLADNLKTGRTSGREAAAIITGALAAKEVANS